MEVDSRTTRGESRGIGSLLLLKKELNVEVEEELEVEICVPPLQAEEEIRVFGFI
jgi:hypothetical protein